MTDALRVREKAHMRDGDTIAAARRRLSMVMVDSTITLIGPHGPVTRTTLCVTLFPNLAGSSVKR
jgi:predicted dithiol-disulfide oxidoreductase (DUF899 family)